MDIDLEAICREAGRDPLGLLTRPDGASVNPPAPAQPAGRSPTACRDTEAGAGTTGVEDGTD